MGSALFTLYYIEKRNKRLLEQRLEQQEQGVDSRLVVEPVPFHRHAPTKAEKKAWSLKKNFDQQLGEARHFCVEIGHFLSSMRSFKIDTSKIHAKAIQSVNAMKGIDEENKVVLFQRVEASDLLLETKSHKEVSSLIIDLEKDINTIKSEIVIDEAPDQVQTPWDLEIESLTMEKILDKLDNKFEKCLTALDKTVAKYKAKHISVIVHRSEEQMVDENDEGTDMFHSIAELRKLVGNLRERLVKCKSKVDTVFVTMNIRILAPEDELYPPPEEYDHDDGVEDREEDVVMTGQPHEDGAKEKEEKNTLRFHTYAYVLRIVFVIFAAYAVLKFGGVFFSVLHGVFNITRCAIDIETSTYVKFSSMGFFDFCTLVIKGIFGTIQVFLEKTIPWWLNFPLHICVIYYVLSYVLKITVLHRMMDAAKNYVTAETMMSLIMRIPDMVIEYFYDMFLFWDENYHRVNENGWAQKSFMGTVNYIVEKFNNLDNEDGNANIGFPEGERFVAIVRN